jgi:carbon storage regulator
MLVLTRRLGETLLIGDDIVVRVVSTSNGAVKLGIEAPADITILRGEVAEREGQK